MNALNAAAQKQVLAARTKRDQAADKWSKALEGATALPALAALPDRRELGLMLARADASLKGAGIAAMHAA